MELNEAIKKEVVNRILQRSGHMERDMSTDLRVKGGAKKVDKSKKRPPRGIGAKRGGAVPAKLKSWVQFLKDYGGQGYTRDELSDMYHKIHGGKRKQRKQRKSMK